MERFSLAVAQRELVHTSETSGVTGIRLTRRSSTMESIGKRSDSRSTYVAASTRQVFAAMNDPARVARWWGPDGFRNTIHQFDFRPGGTWLLTMHGPDGRDYPNESRFDQGTQVHWRQTFDTVEHYEKIAQFVAGANEQNLHRLAAEVLESRDVA